MKIKNLILFAGNFIAGLIILQLIFSLVLLNGNFESGKAIFVSLSIVIAVLTVLTTFVVVKKLNTSFQNLLRILSKARRGKFDKVINVTEFSELKLISESINSILHQLRLKTEYLDNIPTPVLIIDKDFNLEYINKAGAELTEKSQDDCKTLKCYDLFKTGHCKSAKCRVGQSMQNGDVRVGYTVANPAKTTLPIMYTGAPIKNERSEIIGGMDFITDITEMDSLQKYLQRNIDKLLVSMKQFEKGDLTVYVTPEKEGDNVSNLIKGFNDAVKNIRLMTERIIKAIETTASVSTEISSSAEQMAAGAQEQSS